MVCQTLCPTFLSQICSLILEHFQKTTHFITFWGRRLKMTSRHISGVVYLYLVMSALCHTCITCMHLSILWNLNLNYCKNIFSAYCYDQFLTHMFLWWDLSQGRYRNLNYVSLRDIAKRNNFTYDIGNITYILRWWKNLVFHQLVSKCWNNGPFVMHILLICSRNH